jgi:hypothetical protein
LVGEEDVSEFLRNGATSAISFFNQVKSNQMVFIEPANRGEFIMNLCRETMHYFQQLTPILEQSQGKQKLVGDLTDVVDREMLDAANKIAEAQLKLQELLKGDQIDVHGAILHAAMAITKAVQNLIKCATESQKEIAGPSQKSGGFYKKNNKWTQGLISAAQAVSVSTVGLVESADDLVGGKGKWEHVVVSAQDVGVATTQLVAAARVKATLYSKTQERLEQAAVVVREATKLLVKAAKDAARIVEESEVLVTVGRMSKHEAKVKEMEQQVRILELEKLLGTARFALGEMRKAGYHQE